MPLKLQPHEHTMSTQPIVPRFRRILNGIRAGATDSGKHPTYKVKDDGKDHAIRIVPGNFGLPADDEGGIGSWFVEAVQHWFPNPKSQNGFSKSVYCKRNQALHGNDPSGDCPFCEAWDQLKEKAETLNDQIVTAGKTPAGSKLRAELDIVKQQIKACSYRSTYMINVLDREDGDKLKIWYAAKTAFEGLHGQYKSHDTEQTARMTTDQSMAKVLTALEKDPENVLLNRQAFEYCDAFAAYSGFDAKVNRKTENGQTKYSVAIGRYPSPLVPDESAIPDILKGAFDLEAIIQESMDEEQVTDIEDYVRYALTQASQKQLSGKGAGNLDFSDRRGATQQPASPDTAYESEAAEDTEHVSAEELAPEDAAYVDLTPAATPPAATPPPATQAAPSTARSQARKFVI